MSSTPGTVRSSDTHPLDVAWVALETAPGRLGLTMAPGRRSAGAPAEGPWQRDLHADLRRLRHAHRCDVLVTLLTPDELDRMGLAGLPSDVDVHGMGHRHLPIVDGSVPAPSQAEDVLHLLDDVRERILAERSVVFHCMAGLGRSGTLAALVVASLWELPHDAIARVRAAQPRAVETVQQEHYVHDAAFAWYRRHAQRRTGRAAAGTP
jgi:ADP-ribosyl-[dinitrogen reductase] hydrolase